MPGMMWTTEKSPNELKPNKYNVSIYGNEKVDSQLVESIKLKGLLEPLVIKDDNTIVSGHRIWLALKELGIKAQCRVMTFNDDLDEKESLIEFNKQRVKNESQFFNEDKTLREIYSIRAKERQKVLAGTRPNVKSDLPLNLAGGIKEKGDTRDKVVDAIGINRNKLDTIREIGELSESGKSVAEKAKEEKETEKAESIAHVKQNAVVLDDEEEAEPIKCTDVKVTERKIVVPEVKPFVAPVDMVTELKKEVAKEVMKKLDNETISINGARQIAKVIQTAPEVAKKAIEMEKLNLRCRLKRQSKRLLTKKTH